MRPVSHDFMRAAHTLTSSSRTTGFHRLADVAHALEGWLADAIDYPPEFTAEKLAATRHAVDGLIAMVHSVGARALPRAREDIVAELGRLREGLQESRRAGEGSHIRRPGGVRDEPGASRGTRAGCVGRFRGGDRADSGGTRYTGAVDSRNTCFRGAGAREPGAPNLRAGRGRADCGKTGSGAAFRGGKGTAQDQGRRRSRPAADLPRRGAGIGARGERRRASVEGQSIGSFAGGRLAPLPAYAEGRRANDGPHAPGGARARARNPGRGHGSDGGSRRTRFRGCRGADRPVLDRAGTAFPRRGHARRPAVRGPGRRSLRATEGQADADRGDGGSSADAGPSGGAAGRASRSAHCAAEGERGHRRPVRERCGRTVDRALAHRGRSGGLQAGPFGPFRERGADAQPASRDRDGLRRADAEPAEGAGGARHHLRSAGVRPVHAHAGTHALPRRIARRRDHAAAGPAEEHRRDGTRDPSPGASQPRPAAGADGGAPGALGESRGPLLPRRAPDREGRRQEGEPGVEGHSRGARPFGAREDHRAVRAPVEKRGGPWHRIAAGARGGRQA